MFCRERLQISVIRNLAGRVKSRRHKLSTCPVGSSRQSCSSLSVWVRDIGRYTDRVQPGISEPCRFRPACKWEASGGTLARRREWLSSASRRAFGRCSVIPRDRARRPEEGLPPYPLCGTNNWFASRRKWPQGRTKILSTGRKGTSMSTSTQTRNEAGRRLEAETPPGTLEKVLVHRQSPHHRRPGRHRGRS